MLPISSLRARLLAAWPVLPQTGWASPAHLLGAALHQPAGRATASTADWRADPRADGGLDPPSRAGRRNHRAEPTGAVLGAGWGPSPPPRKPHLRAPPSTLRLSPPGRVLPKQGLRRPARPSGRGPEHPVEWELAPPVPDWPPLTEHMLYVKRLLALLSINPRNSPNYENKSTHLAEQGLGMPEPLSPQIESLSSGYLWAGLLQGY